MEMNISIALTTQFSERYKLNDHTLALAKQGRSIEAQEMVSVSANAERAWDSANEPEATLVYEDDIRITSGE